MLKCQQTKPSLTHAALSWARGSMGDSEVSTEVTAPPSPIAAKDTDSSAGDPGRAGRPCWAVSVSPTAGLLGRGHLHLHLHLHPPQFLTDTTRGHQRALTSAKTGLPSSSVAPFFISIYKDSKTLLMLLIKSSNSSTAPVPGEKWAGALGGRWASGKCGCLVIPST